MECKPGSGGHRGDSGGFRGQVFSCAERPGRIPICFGFPWLSAALSLDGGIPQLLPGTGQASARIWEAVRILETERENGGTIIEENGSSAKKTGIPRKMEWRELLQEGIKLGSVIWAVGLWHYDAVSGFGNLRMRRKTGTAVRLVEGVYECDGISEPFAAGIFRPRIYLLLNFRQRAGKCSGS